MKLSDQVKRFFYPEAGSPRWMFFVPYVTLILLFIGAIFGGIQTWEYTNSNQFCGTACHTMPPQSTAFQESPHSNVTCEECHIGRASFMDQAIRKTQGIKEAYYEIFDLYEYPIRARALRPSLDTCEKCHRPETFSDDSLRQIHRFGNDHENTATSIYLIMKTGGVGARDENARGIHWHISSKVLYYADDELAQVIPYVRAYNDDGTYVEYIDVEAGFDPSTLDESQLKQMDCITCHNRITHNFSVPYKSVDKAMADGLIDPSIPLIHYKAVTALSTQYASRDEAVEAITNIEEDYKQNLSDYYSQNEQAVKDAVAEVQAIYDRTVFNEHEIDWTTYPNNLGHIDSPGCFRCHDGKHLDPDDKAVRLECNVCHAIPVVADEDDFVTTIEIGRGPEPETHLNPNWISMHNQTLGPSCSNCHDTKDPGGTSNTSFCSNSACHGNAFTYAGFDAPALREIIKDQLPPPEPEPDIPILTGDPTFNNYIGILFNVKCTECHSGGDSASEGLDLSSYELAILGSENGPVLLAADAANSRLVQVQGKKHFANLTDEELQIVIDWINNGMPED